MNGCGPVMTISYNDHQMDFYYNKVQVYKKLQTQRPGIASDNLAIISVPQSISWSTF